MGCVRPAVHGQVPQLPKCSRPSREGARVAPHGAANDAVSEAVLTRVELADVADRPNTYTLGQLENLAEGEDRAFGRLRGVGAGPFGRAGRAAPT
jgi:hypothetical protein